MLVMRITVTLDDDLMAALKERARLLDQPFKQVVNDLLRCGLARAATEAEVAKEQGKAKERPVFRVKPNHSGFRPGIDPLKLNQLNAELEDEEFLRKYRA